MRNLLNKSIQDSGSFLPADYIQRRAETRANLIALSLFGVVMFAVVGAYFVTNRQQLEITKEQQQINEQYVQEKAKIDQLKELESQRTQMLEKAAVTTALVEKVPRSVLVADLVSRMPENITLTDVKLVNVKLSPQAAKAEAGTRNLAGSKGKAETDTSKSSGKSSKKGAPKTASKESEAEKAKVAPPTFNYKITLTGVAKSNNDVADYLAALKQSPILDQVDIKFIQPKQIEKVELRGFELELSIRKDADARGMEPIKELRQGTAKAKADEAAMEAVRSAVEAFKTAITTDASSSQEGGR